MKNSNCIKCNDKEVARQGNAASRAAWIDSRIPAIFLIAGLVIGLLYVFVLPPMQVPDEMMHFARVYSVSKGVCLASPDIDMPKSFEQLHYTFPPWLEQSRLISGDDLLKALKIPLDEQKMAGNGRLRSLLEGFINQNQLSCIPYVPSAIAMNAGRHIGLSPIVLMYLVRITNLLIYLALVYLSLRLLPDFRIILFCIALMPMAMHQAASTSADSFTFAVSFLFTAYVFRLAFDREPIKLGIRQYVLLALLVLVVVMSKSMISVVILLLLIPAERFKPRRNRWIAIVACVLLAIAVSTAWQHANKANFQRLTEERLLRGSTGLETIDVNGNIRFMYEHPVALATIFFRSGVDPEYLRANIEGFVGILGWLSIRLPEWLIWLYAGLLLAAALTQARQTQLTLSVRALLAVFIIAGVANTMAAGWILETPKFVIDTPAEWESFRVYSQGRYWVPLVFPLLVAFSTGKTRLEPRYFAAIALGVILIATVVAMYAIRMTYYF